MLFRSTSASSFRVNENSTDSVTELTATDPEGDEVSFSLGGDDADSFTLNSPLSFVTAPDYETKASYSIKVIASDGTNTSEQNVTISIQNLNDNNPVFSSSSSFEFNEDAVGEFETMLATDADGDTITYSLSGDDASYFSLDSSSGVLSFVGLSGEVSYIGTYSITITASDGENSTDIAVSVSVLDQTAPVFTSAEIFTAAENQRSIGRVTATDAQAVTFTISGSELEITSAGVLTFAETPDYETKTTYTATVTATDVSGNTATQDITVIVTNDTSDDEDTGTGTGTGTGTQRSRRRDAKSRHRAGRGTAEGVRERNGAAEKTRTSTGY